MIFLYAFFAVVVWGSFHITQAPYPGEDGFVWYGAREIFMSAAVPMRDFQSYFPGRYYWIAGFFSTLGEGLKEMRIACCAFQFLALVAALFIFSRVSRTFSPMFHVSCFVFLCLMIVPFRYFDAGLVAMELLILIALIEKPEPSFLQATGLFHGIIFWFAFNHGIYFGAALCLLFLLTILKEGRIIFRRIHFYFYGLFLGILPLILFYLFVPGFSGAFLDFFGTLVSRNNDLAYAVPWPWLVSWKNIVHRFPSTPQRLLEWINVVSIGWLYVLYYLFCGISWLVMIRIKKEDLRKNAVWVGCVILSSIYFHHMGRCRGLIYVGESMLPCYVGLLAINGKTKPLHFLKKAVVCFMVLCIAGAFFLASSVCKKIFLSPALKDHIRIGRDIYWDDVQSIQLIRNIEDAVNRHVPREESIFIAPLWSTFYCILDKKNPSHELYLIFPETEARQQRIIDDLHEKNVRWALVGNVFVEGNLNFHLSKTHPKLWSYFMDNFNVVVEPELPRGHFLMVRKDIS